MKPWKPWTNEDALELIGKVVNLQVGSEQYKSVYLKNLRLPRSSEDRVLVQFVTDRGRGQSGYIRTRAVSIVATGEPSLYIPEEIREDINTLAGDQG